MGIYYEAATTELRETAQQGVDAFKRQVAQAGLPSAECRIANEEANAALTLQGHYADLVVLSQSNPDIIRGVAVDAVLPQHVLLHVARPVLLVPYAGTFSHIGLPLQHLLRIISIMSNKRCAYPGVLPCLTS